MIVAVEEGEFAGEGVPVSVTGRGILCELLQAERIRRKLGRTVLRNIKVLRITAY